MVCPVYIAEPPSAARRGRLGSLFQLGIVVGIFLTLFINARIQGFGDEAWNTASGWRWMLGAELAPAVFLLALLVFVPESPRWLLTFAEVVIRPGAWAIAKRWPRVPVFPGHRCAMARAPKSLFVSLLLRRSIIQAGRKGKARQIPVENGRTHGSQGRDQGGPSPVRPRARSVRRVVPVPVSPPLADRGGPDGFLAIQRHQRDHVLLDQDLHEGWRHKSSLWAPWGSCFTRVHKGFSCCWPSSSSPGRLPWLSVPFRGLSPRRSFQPNCGAALCRSPRPPSGCPVASWLRPSPCSTTARGSIPR